MLTDYIVDKVQHLIDRCGTRDPYRISDALKIRIRKLDLKQKVKGYYFYQSRIETIVIDESLSEPFCRILAAHELGHAILHKEIAMLKGFAELEIPLSYEKENAHEREANLFAAELLLDDREVIQTLKDHTFFETASLLNVPAALLDYKFYLMHKKGYALSDMSLAKADFLKNNTEGTDPLC